VKMLSWPINTEDAAVTAARIGIIIIIIVLFY
jgi:hypothetical protein